MNKMIIGHTINNNHVIFDLLIACLFQSFSDLKHKPQLVDLTVEEGQRLKVIYGSNIGFHAIDLDTSSVFDLYIPSHVSSSVT